MKKFLCILLFGICLAPLTAASADFYWDFGTAFGGGNFGFKKNDFDFEWEADIQVLDFRLETANGFTFSFSPFNCWCVLNAPEEKDIYLITFGNFTAGWDIFKHDKDIELMPYVSAFAGALGGLEKFRVDAGLIFNLYLSEVWPEAMIAAEENMHLRCELISAKTGVRWNQNKPQVYFDVGLNLISIGMIICSGGPENFEPCSYP